MLRARVKSLDLDLLARYNNPVCRQVDLRRGGGIGIPARRAHAQVVEWYTRMA